SGLSATEVVEAVLPFLSTHWRTIPEMIQGLGRNQDRMLYRSNEIEFELLDAFLPQHPDQDFVFWYTAAMHADKNPRYPPSYFLVPQAAMESIFPFVLSLDMWVRGSLDQLSSAVGDYIRAGGNFFPAELADFGNRIVQAMSMAQAG